MSLPSAPSSRRRRSLLAGCCLLAFAAAPAHAADDEVVVFAAASLGDVLQAIARQGGFGTLKFSFAASSTLARQIEQGAPAQLFISADEAWMDTVQRSGLLLSGSRRDLASNRLALVRPSRGAPEPAAPPETADAIRALLQPVLGSADARIGTGDPAHAPVGRYAQAALTQLGLWDATAPRLARADNVRSALALVERGEAPLGIVYRTDALASAKVEVAALFPAASHAPIRYPAALLQGATPQAQRFHSYLFGPEAQALLRQAGFGPAPP
jgi:molybdate transport system substrate-binding protein